MTSPRVRRLRLIVARLMPFWWWLLWFYCGWTALVLTMHLWPAVTAHWPIAAAMAAGSYVAGSTPMGGGTIGFPVLVLFFDGPAALGRGFSFCIQSIGMSSATVFLLASRAPIAGRLLLWGMLATAVSTPLTVIFLAPLVSDLTVKLLFSCLWAAFGVLTLLRIRDLVRAHHLPTLPHRLEAMLGLTAGMLGGVSTGLTGVGVDMVIYTVLVLIYRCDLRPAIGTSIILMAFGSLVGVITSAALGRLDQEVFHNWLAAAPIVAVGAPFGALMMRVIPRNLTLMFVAMLCVVQLIWTGVNERLSPSTWVLAVSAVVVANLLFHGLYRWGKRLVPEHPVPSWGGTRIGVRRSG